MNIGALIDFNKYTLALAAAVFAYALEKLSPDTAGRAAILTTLLILAASTLAGMLLFAVATAASHYMTTGTTDLPPKHGKAIQLLGIAHSLLLAIGIVMLGALLLVRIANPPPANCPGLTITFGTQAR